MEHIGIDVHKVESQICILTESGETVECRIRTQRERFAAVLGVRASAKILIESSMESEWVARCLEGLGHEVIVADPNFAAMYATRSRKVKTDRRDARTLPRPAAWAPIESRIGRRIASGTCERSWVCEKRHQGERAAGYPATHGALLRLGYGHGQPGLRAPKSAT